jgi:hypothetical protein
MPNRKKFEWLREEVGIVVCPDVPAGKFKRVFREQHSFNLELR